MVVVDTVKIFEMILISLRFIFQILECVTTTLLRAKWAILEIGCFLAISIATGGKWKLAVVIIHID